MKIFLLGLVAVIFIGGAAFVLLPKKPSIESKVGSTPGTSPSGKTYTLTDLSSHSTKEDCWLAVDGNVYDVTTFIPSHPGGEQILAGCGQDASAMFHAEREHSSGKPQAIMPTYLIGSLAK